MTEFFSAQVPPPENWEDFESLCCDLWTRIWQDDNTKRHGRRGQPQHGVDIYGQPHGQNDYAGVQCKGKDNFTHTRLSCRELREEVEKAKGFRPRLQQFILATTSPKDARIEQLERALTTKHKRRSLFSVHVWAWADIRLRLADHPDLIRKHFKWLFAGIDATHALPGSGRLGAAAHEEQPFKMVSLPSAPGPSPPIERTRALVHYNRGVQLAKENSLADAERAFAQAIEIDPSIPEAHCNLGTVLLRTHAGDQARQCFQRALALNPQLPQALLGMARYCAETGEPDKSQEWLRQAAENTQDAGILAETAHLHLQAGRVAAAQHLYEQLIAANPDDYIAHYNLGNCYARLKRDHDAVRMFQRATELRPTFLMAWNNLGHTLNQAGDHDAAENALRVARELANEREPDNYHPWFSSGHNDLDRGRLEKAEHHFRRVTEIAPDFPGGWEGLGETQELAGHPEEAAKSFARAHQLRLAETDRL